MKAAQFEHSELPLLEQLRRKNELSANRLTSIITLAAGVITGLILISYYFGDLRLGYHYTVVCTWIVFLSRMAAGVFGIVYKGVHPVVRWHLILNFIIGSCLLFFCFGTHSDFFVIVAILLSARYYDRNFTLWAASLNYAFYLTACFTNVALDSVFHDVYLQHRINGTPVWCSYYDVFIYEVCIHTGEFILISLLSANMVRYGKKLGEQRLNHIRNEETMKTELSVGARIQSSILPRESFVSKNGRISLHATMRPAKEVAGDFYDYFMVTDSVLVFLVADVSDKGLPAAMFMMRAKGEVRAAVCDNDNLTDAICTANRRLMAGNDINMFVTLWIGTIDIRTGEGHYVNAGHDYPLLRRRDGSITTLENRPDTFLGVFGEYSPTMHSFTLREGETLLLYTDGVTDCISNTNERYGMDRLEEAFSEGSQDPERLLRDILRSCGRFSSGEHAFDDMTLLAVRMAAEDDTFGRFTVDASYGDIAGVIAAINAKLERSACPVEKRRQIDTALDEIGTNIADYAYSDGDGKMDISYLITESSFMVMFCDNGKEFNPLEKKDPDISSIPENGGLGIFLAKSLMDSVRYERTDGQNRLIMEKGWKNV